MIKGRNPNVGTHAHGAKLGGVKLKTSSQSAPAGNSSQILAKTQMKPGRIAGADGSTDQAESQIKASPVPFQNPRGAAMQKPASDGTSVNSKVMKGIGDGQSKNVAGLRSVAKPGMGAALTASKGNPFPKKRFAQSGQSKFYGGR